MSAAAAGNAGGVKWLLQAGADATFADTRGRTAADYILNPVAKVRLAPAPAPCNHLFSHYASPSHWFPGQAGRVAAVFSAHHFHFFSSQPQQR
jgi:hypothetical protein